MNGNKTTPTYSLRRNLNINPTAEIHETKVKKFSWRTHLTTERMEPELTADIGEVLRKWRGKQNGEKRGNRRVCQLKLFYQHLWMGEIVVGSRTVR